MDGVLIQESDGTFYVVCVGCKTDATPVTTDFRPAPDYGSAYHCLVSNGWSRPDGRWYCPHCAIQIRECVSLNTSCPQR
jgi:hypothetical protein